MARSGFKMKGSPMARNFGIGASPARKDDDTVQQTIDSGSFDNAFASASKRGAKQFTWRGDPYTTEKSKKKNPVRKNEEVAKGKTYGEVEVSGGKKTSFDDRNRVMTPDELKKANINPKKGTTYYKNIKTGQMSTATKAQ